MRRRWHNDKLYVFKKTFSFLNSSEGWLGTETSPFFAFYLSYLQQKAPNITVGNLMDKRNVVKKLYRLSSIIAYLRSTDEVAYIMSLVAFADASKGPMYG